MIGGMGRLKVNEDDDEDEDEDNFVVRRAAGLYERLRNDKIT